MIENHPYSYFNKYINLEKEIRLDDISILVDTFLTAARVASLLGRCAAGASVAGVKTAARWRCRGLEGRRPATGVCVCVCRLSLLCISDPCRRALARAYSHRYTVCRLVYQWVYKNVTTGNCFSGNHYACIIVRPF